MFNTLYLQLLGFSDFHASLIASLFLAGTAVGSQIGGILGDWAAKRSPNHGRILVAQFSVGIGVPMSAVVYKVSRMESLQETKHWRLSLGLDSHRSAQ